MEDHTRKQLTLLAILTGINAVNVTEPGVTESIHGWQAALADQLGVTPNVLTHWLRRGHMPAKRAAEAEHKLGIKRQKWYRYDLTERHLYNAAVTGDPDRPPVQEPRQEPSGGRADAFTLEPGDHIRVADALTRTAHILESGSPYSRALYHNIISFDRALHNERQLETLTSENERLSTRIEEMEERQAEITREMERRLSALEHPSAGRKHNNRA